MATYRVEEREREVSSWIRDYPNGQGASSMVAWLALGISLLSLFFAFFQYYRSKLAPSSLIVMPPAITQANDDFPSIIVHLALTNTGGRAAVVSDVAVRFVSKGKEVPLTLHAQKVLANMASLGSLPLSEARTYSVFLPILVRHDEAMTLDLVCTPFVSELPLKEEDVLSIDGLILDLWIDGQEKKAVFTFPYQDYHDKFKGGGIIEIPKAGFAPRWYRDRAPVRITQSF